jgi:hypothetical protein
MKSQKIVKPKSKADKIIKFRVLNKHIYEKEKCVGQCWPFTRKHVIEVDPRQCPKDYLDTLIHEALHELLPNKSEKIILRLASSLANLLWRLGYRKIKKRR